MPVSMKTLLEQYTKILQKIYGKHLKSVILYGSYARGDYREDSDIDIMILLDLSDIDIKQYRHELAGETFDFNMDHDLDIKPIAKSEKHFLNWVDVYPFYANVKKEGGKIYLMQPDEKGTQKDLIFYRIETAQSDIKAAEILLNAKEFEVLIIGHIMVFIMQFQQYMH